MSDSSSARLASDSASFWNLANFTSSSPDDTSSGMGSSVLKSGCHPMPGCVPAAKILSISCMALLSLESPEWDISALAINSAGEDIVILSASVTFTPSVSIGLPSDITSDVTESVVSARALDSASECVVSSTSLSLTSPISLSSSGAVSLSLSSWPSDIRVAPNFSASSCSNPVFMVPSVSCSSSTSEFLSSPCTSSALVLASSFMISSARAISVSVGLPSDGGWTFNVGISIWRSLMFSDVHSSTISSASVVCDSWISDVSSNARSSVFSACTTALTWLLELTWSFGGSLPCSDPRPSSLLSSPSDMVTSCCGRVLSAQASVSSWTEEMSSLLCISSSGASGWIGSSSLWTKISSFPMSLSCSACLLALVMTTEESTFSAGLSATSELDRVENVSFSSTTIPCIWLFGSLASGSSSALSSIIDCALTLVSSDDTSVVASLEVNISPSDIITLSFSAGSAPPSELLDDAECCCP